MDKDRLESLINQNFTCKQIALELNSSKTNVRYWIKKLGLKLKKGARGKLPKNFRLLRKCKCGETNPDLFYGNKSNVCAKCHNKNNLIKGQQNRLYMVDKLGNKCVNCGFDKYKSSLDIHHLDPNEKDVGFKTVRL